LEAAAAAAAQAEAAKAAEAAAAAAPTSSNPDDPQFVTSDKNDTSATTPNPVVTPAVIPSAPAVSVATPIATPIATPVAVPAGESKISGDNGRKLGTTVSITGVKEVGAKIKRMQTAYHIHLQGVRDPWRKRYGNQHHEQNADKSFNLTVERTFTDFKTLHAHCVGLGIANLPPMPDQGGAEMFVKARTHSYIMVRKAAFEKIIECVCNSFQAAATDELIGEFFGVWTFDMPGRNQHSRFDQRRDDKKREDGRNAREAERSVSRGPAATFNRFLRKAKRAAGM
jgi:hypothetical protein